MTELLLGQRSEHYLVDVSAKKNPYDLLNELRDSEPVHRAANGCWIVSDYDLGVQILRDSRFSRSEATRNAMPDLFELGPASELFAAKMVNSEGDDHLRLRRLLSPAFTPAAIGKWRPYIKSVVDKLIDDLRPSGQAEMVQSFCYPLPEHLICTILGVPFEDHERFEAWTQAMNDRPRSGITVEDGRRRRTEAISSFQGYLADLVDARRGSLGNDLLSTLIRLEEDGDRLSDTELVAVSMEVINGGHDTTASALALAILALLTHPEELDSLKRDPTLVTNAVEEVLRMHSPVQLSLARVTTETIELGGAIVSEGETVFVSLAGANRGPAVVDGDRFDVGRRESKHLSFGIGAHHCLGAHLARAELQIALERLVLRLPDLQLLVEAEALPWRTTPLVVAPAALPVGWTVQTI